MHQSSYHLMTKFRDRIDHELPAGTLTVLDVGSYGVNGTYRDVFSDTARFSYTGLDLQPGPNVDCVPKDAYDWPELADASFDVIVSGQAFEHMEFPWLAIDEMHRKLKDNGLICIVAPSRGPEHRYPLDCWRYYPDGMRALARWAGLTVLDLGTFWGASGFTDGSDQWGDSFCVLRKSATSRPGYACGRRPAPRVAAINKNSPLDGGKKGAYYSFTRSDVVDVVIKNGLAASRILEVGCSEGGTGKKLKELLPVEQYVGVEISEAAATAARRCLDRVITADIENCDLREHGVIPSDYDLVLALDVLEHLYDPWAALARLAEYVKPGGHMVASLPNIQNISVLGGLVEGSWRYDSAGILDATHLRFFTIAEAERLFAGAGLDVTKTDYVLNPPVDLAKIHDRGNVLKHGKLTLSGLSRDEVLRFYTYQYIVTARKPAAVSIPSNVPPAALAKTVIPGRTSIVILTINQLDVTKECVASIQKHTPEPHEIVFVDNGSTDGTVEWLRSLAASDSSCHVIENATNLGFARGCNQGILAATGDIILLLNNDVVVTPQWLSGMLECLHSRPDTGVVGPMTNNISGPQKVPNVDYRSPAVGLCEYAAAFRERNRHRRVPLRRIVGFCMLFRRSLVDTVGMLDERFGSGNFEDDDFCLRAALLGYTNIVAGDVFVHHYGSRSFVGNRLDFGACMTGNRKLFSDKWSGIGVDTALGKRLTTVQAIENALRLHAEGKTNAAVEAILRGIGRATDPRDLHRTLAEILIDTRHFKEALEALHEDAANVADPQHVILTGTCQQGLAMLDSADQAADQVLAGAATSAPALNLKALVAHQRGDNAQAADWCRKAIAADPGHAEPYTNLGVLEWAAGRTEAALPLLERGFLLAPQRADLVTAYHNAISALDERPRAEQIFSEARALNPFDRRITFLLIDILIHQDKHAAAMELIEEAMLAFGIDDGMLDAALTVRQKVGPHNASSEHGQRGRLSVCMIVKNEERNLLKSLASLKPMAHEIIVVDTGSDDRTRRVATAFGAKVFEFPWTGNFAEARNESLAKAEGDWILVVDADEVVAATDYPTLRDMICKRPGRAAAWSFVTRNYIQPVYTAGWTANTGAYAREEAGTGWFPSTKIRLFPNDRRIRFSNAVHELVEPAIRKLKLTVKPSPVPIHHYGKLNQEKDLVKGETYYALGKKKLDEQGDNLDALRELATQAAGLGKHQEAIDLWQRAIRLQPNLTLAHLNLGSLYLELNRFEDALASSRRALVLESSMKEAAYNTALCELYAGTAETAVAILEDLMIKEPEYPSAAVLRSLALCCTGESSVGLELLRRLQTMDFGFAKTLTSFAKKLVVAGKRDYACQLLNAAVESGNTNDEVQELRESCRAQAA